MTDGKTRRIWLRSGLMVASLSAMAPARADEKEDVSPAEDLMREHGVLKRVLLAYREVINRIDGQHDFPVAAVRDSARLIRSFVEDYHEKLEEDYLFPRFRKANQLTDLVEVLNRQHQAGRALTDRTIELTQSGSAPGADTKKVLRDYLFRFVRMYEPHEAREDTVLFPAFRKIVSKHEYDALGEEFEKKENQLFHGDGFEKNVEAVTRIEKQLGIYDLAQFTPA
jgi:hemerythrin-like domain-containing protein